MINPLLGYSETEEYDTIIAETVYPYIVKAFLSIAKTSAPETDAFVIAATKHLAAAIDDLCTECRNTMIHSKEYDSAHYDTCKEYAEKLLNRLLIREKKGASSQ